MFMAASLSQVRPLTCAGGGLFPGRLVPQPPDLIKWVKREGGFVHHAVIVTQQLDGLGLVAREEIPKGSALIVLPDHIPLKFGASEADSETGSYSSLVRFAEHVPGMSFPFSP